MKVCHDAFHWYIMKTQYHPWTGGFEDHLGFIYWLINYVIYASSISLDFMHLIMGLMMTCKTFYWP